MPGSRLIRVGSSSYGNSDCTGSSRMSCPWRRSSERYGCRTAGTATEAIGPGRDFGNGSLRAPKNSEIHSRAQARLDSSLPTSRPGHSVRKGLTPSAIDSANNLPANPGGIGSQSDSHQVAQMMVQCEIARRRLLCFEAFGVCTPSTRIIAAGNRWWWRNRFRIVKIVRPSLAHEERVCGLGVARIPH